MPLTYALAPRRSSQPGSIPAVSIQRGPADHLDTLRQIVDTDALTYDTLTV